LVNVISKKNRLDVLGNEEYDIVIIGGGITGANVLWDASLRGFKALLLEKNDYASGTTQATSKLIHGGLRYLKNLEFGLVRESLRERRILAKISPHAVRTLGFIVPLYSHTARYVLKAGMELYNLLSYDRNSDISSDRLIPRYHWNSLAETIYKTPSANREELIGSYQYYDYANINPERHTSEFISSAKERGGHAFNYTEVKFIRKQNRAGYIIGVYDKVTGKEKTILCKTVVNSAGPWADLIESIAGVTHEKNLVRSKGIHAVVRNICSKECIILQKKDGSHLFVIPWRNKTIIGTTDTKYEGDPNEFSVKESEILDLLAEVNRSFGFSTLTLKDVDYYYGGLRPLVEDPTEKSETYSASRKSEIMHYAEEGFPGFFSALGGKYTTSRSVAESLVDRITEYLPNSARPCSTHLEPLLGGHYDNLKTLTTELEKKFPKIDGEKIEQIAIRYGSLAHKILQNKPGANFKLANGEWIFEEEIFHILENDDIVSATDFYFRRSGVGTIGALDVKTNQLLIARIAKQLYWDKKRTAFESKLVDQRYIWAKG